MVSAQESLKRMVQRLNIEVPVHLVADAAFGTESMISWCQAHKVNSTFSISTRESDYVWKLLERNLGQGQWCGCAKGNVLYSVYRATADQDDAVHHLITTGFSFEIPPIIAHTIGSPSQQPVTPQEPLVTVDFLMEKKLKELQEMAIKERIRTSGTKRKLAERIISICHPSSSQQNERKALLEKIDQTKFATEPIHHDYYRSNFNCVDLVNRLWYQFCFSFHVYDWRQKMLLSILSTGVINSWVLYNENVKSTLKSFRIDISRSLSNF
jgi:hypothetical protein